jgi:hypothetical protein
MENKQTEIEQKQCDAGKESKAKKKWQKPKLEDVSGKGQHCRGF